MNTTLTKPNDLAAIAPKRPAVIPKPRPRRQITRLTADLATVHIDAVEGDGWRSPADTWVQHRGQPIYRVTDCRVLVYCEDMMTHSNPNDRQPWQPVTAPTWLDSHQGVVAWLVSSMSVGSVNAGEVEVAA